MVTQPPLASDAPLASPDRLAALTRHLYTVGSASIPELADLTGASEATIRRDLRQLAAAGTVQRSHGGAQITSRTDEHLAFDLREHENLAAKRAIGEAAYALLRPNTSVMLDSGTTVLQLAKRLRIDPLHLTVVTNGIKVALELLAVPQVHVVFLGGTLRQVGLSSDGPQAEAMLERLWFDQVFIGAGGIGSDAVIYSLDEPGAHLNLRMRARTEECHVLADATKFGRRGTYQVLPISAARSVITDEALSKDWRKMIVKAGSAATIVPTDRRALSANQPGEEA